MPRGVYARKTAPDPTDSTKRSTSGVTLADLSGAIQKQVKAIKGRVLKIADQFAVVRVSLKEVAPQVMRIFNAIKVEHENFTFVEFARLYAPDMPTHSADRDGVIGYKNHKVYYTLDQMRRVVNLRPRGQQGVRDSAVDALARTIRTVIEVAPDQAPAIWQAIQAEFQYPERIMNRLKKRVAATEPLFTISKPKGARVKIGNVIHMERTAAPQAAAPAGPDLAQPRQRIRATA